MKTINNTEKFTDKQWEELASVLSDESTGSKDLLEMFREHDNCKTEENWRAMTEKEDDVTSVDRAWNKIKTRIEDADLVRTNIYDFRKYRLINIMKVAALVLLLIGTGSTIFYLNYTGVLSKKVIYSTNADQKNLEVTLTDGSTVYLNRNSVLTFRSKFASGKRKVALSGEAFFKVKHDDNKPFIVDAGKAEVKVLGTSFNVITNNPDNSVEVFVSTGSVMVSDNIGTQNLILEPGFIGTLNSGTSNKAINSNPNYMAWNTGMLVYTGQKLEVVFRDLKRVHNIDISADNPEILEKTIRTVFDNQNEETIIRIICTTFNLRYKKDGSVYTLSEK
jgi:transmembrane sensor